MRWFYCHDIPAPKQLCDLSPDESRHGVRVLRKRTGEPVGLLNGRGTVATAVVVEATVAARTPCLRVRVRSVARLAPTSPVVRLYIAPPRARLMGTVVQQAVELGVSAIQPVHCEFSVAKPAATAIPDSWRADAVTAMKQSGNPWLPELRPLRSFADCLEDPELGTMLLGTPAGGTVVSGPLAPTGVVTIWIGPEGGFTAAETESLLSSGAVPVQVGPCVLRVETAVPALLGWLYGAVPDRSAAVGKPTPERLS